MKVRVIKGSISDLVVSHLPLVNAAAARVRRYISRQSELDDVIADGLLALYEVAQRHRPDDHIDFASYTKQQIRGAILDGLKKRCSMPHGRRSTKPRNTAVQPGCTFESIPTELKRSHEFGMALFHLHNASGVSHPPVASRRQGGGAAKPTATTGVSGSSRRK
jgi:hypothetical protein